MKTLKYLRTMKKNILIGLFLITTYTFSQNNLNWQGVFLTVSGHHEKDGVEAYFALSQCDGEDVIILKLVNKNNVDVTVSWQPAIFTQSKQWINTTKTKTLTIGAGQTLTGDCQTNNALKINLQAWGISAESFYRYAMNYFDVK